MVHRAAFGFAAVVALLLAGCSAPQGDPATASAVPSVQQEMPTAVVQSAGGKKAVVHAGVSSATEEGGQLIGSLAADGAGCIVVRTRDGETTTLVFPQGTVFEGEALALPDGSSLSDGDNVALDGARVPADEKLSICPNYARLFSVVRATVNP
jgi:putative hemolysin